MSECGFGSTPSESIPAAKNSHTESSSAPAPAAKVTFSVAAASDLKFGMDDLIKEFMRQHPMIVVKGDSRERRTGSQLRKAGM